LGADVLVGLDAPDDAAVYALDAGRALVSTVDFFTPIVDDPYTFGAITAANAMSDIYAMGGRPLFALNIVAFPIDELDKSVLLDILRGGAEKAKEAGVVVIGGHSIEDKEPKYGMAVVGTVSPDRIYRKSAGRAGDALVLTKAIGTGIIATAIKRGTAPEDSVRAAVDSMLGLNDRALELAGSCDVGAMTDVTGFGLIGHLADLARQSGLAAVLQAAEVPVLPGALALAQHGHVPGGSKRNRDFVAPHTEWADRTTESEKLVLCDAQTSGGLLVSVAREDSEGLVEALRSAGHTAATVGRLESGPPGRIRVL
jgi:selenide,water dikinase